MEIGEGREEEEEEHRIESEVEADEEEDDVDFNPFLLNSPSPEASSSLSSENDGPLSQGRDSSYFEAKATEDSRAEDASRNQNSEQRDEVVGSNESLVNEMGLNYYGGNLSRVDFDTNTEQELLDQTMNALPELNISGKPVIDIQREEDADTEDAICRRTRARYSLKDMALDELEAFLQESDEEDYFQNVNDEEEYQKFLAAVICNADGNVDVGGELGETAGVEEEEDEDNDADFEMEIEEALESDPEDKWGRKENTRPPETRRKKQQQKTSEGTLKSSSSLNKTKLRPLLPNLLGVTVPYEGDRLFADGIQNANASFTGMKFTPHQIGQLHCLIYEHAQLLIQTYSLCVSDPARREFAPSLKNLILELANKKEEALSYKKFPFPAVSFQQISSTPQRPHLPLMSFICPYLEMSGNPMNFEKFFGRNVGSDHHTDGYMRWAPVLNGPICSVLDVAPLHFAKEYLSDIGAAVSEYKRQTIKDGNFRIPKEPLFPLPDFPICEETAVKVKKSVNPKKTLAGNLVESTKTNSIALVPESIALLAKRFIPLFNWELFPRVPPPITTANRVLFSEAEDDLLAMGLMTFNTDWRAIQQRFLPSKSVHQIFVRQKNRSAAKSPDNPIKSIKHMKSSPLTDLEKSLIQEGLKVLKLDWSSVWRHYVPHRDPMLLPRQWRVAIGAQKSYRAADETSKEKRRLYEARRRFAKASFHSMPQEEDYQLSTVDLADNNAEEDEDDEEAYVHEAFLADWEPKSSDNCISSKSARGKNLLSSARPANRSRHALSNGIGGSTKNSGSLGECITRLPPETGKILGRPCNLPSHCIASKVSATACNAKHSKAVGHVRSRVMSPGNNGFQLVKLAPDLPPVNLPASVRVFSVSSLNLHHDGMHPVLNSFGAKPYNCEVGKTSTLASKTMGKRINSKDTCSEISCQEDCHQNEGGLQIHPLLLRTDGEGSPSNPPTIVARGSNSWTSISGNAFQCNFGDLFRKQNLVASADGCREVMPIVDGVSTIDFHPLLQRIDDVERDHSSSSSPVQSSPGSDDPTNMSDKGNQLLSLDPAAVLRADFCDNAEDPDLDFGLHLGPVKEKVSIKVLTAQRANGNHKEVNKTTKGDGKANDTFQCFQSYDVVDSSSLCAQSSVQIDLRESLANGFSNTPHVFVNASASYVEKSVEDGQDSLSAHGILMEHEELSDSDDEGQEHVEFECEEMTDSEEERPNAEETTLAGSKDNLDLKLAEERNSEKEDGHQAWTPPEVTYSMPKSSEENRSCDEPNEMAKRLANRKRKQLASRLSSSLPSQRRVRKGSKASACNAPKTFHSDHQK